MGAIGRSFQLVKVCLHVLSLDRELLVFPLLSGAAALAVMLSFLGVGLGVGALDRLGGGAGGLQAIDYVVFFLFYFANYFVIIFFNSALVYAAHHRLSGGDPSVGMGLRGASQHLGSILVWAAISATVGLILRGVSDRNRNSFITQIVGAAWTLATFFVVPLIVIEGRGVGGSMKQSLSLFKRTWGEQVVGNFGLGVASLVVSLAALAVLALLFMVLSPLGGAGVALVAVLGVVTFVGIGLVFSALDGIFKAALYVYASTGRVPELFPAEVVRESFEPRRERGPGFQ